MCSKVPITTGLGGRELRNAPNVPRDFVCFRYVGRDFLEKTRGIVLSSTDDFINTPFCVSDTFLLISTINTHHPPFVFPLILNRASAPPTLRPLRNTAVAPPFSFYRPYTCPKNTNTVPFLQHINNLNSMH